MTVATPLTGEEDLGQQFVWNSVNKALGWRRFLTTIFFSGERPTEQVNEVYVTITVMEAKKFENR